MSMTVESAAEVMRESMRETVKRHSGWYLVQSALMVLAGVLALIFPAVSSVAVVFYLGWLLIISGVLQGISLIDVHHVPNFWIQLLSVVLFVVVCILFLRNPEAGPLSLTPLLIVFFMVEGFSKLIFALTIRPFRTGVGSCSAVWSASCSLSFFWRGPPRRHFGFSGCCLASNSSVKELRLAI